MKYASKLLCLIYLIYVLVSNFSVSDVSAKAVSIPTPKISLKTISKSTGVKITVGKTKDAESFEIVITGKASVNKEYREYINVNGEGQNSDNIKVTEYIYNDGSKKNSLVIRYLPEGTYSVKVRSWNSKKYGVKLYSQYSKKKNFKLKAQSEIGYF